MEKEEMEREEAETEKEAVRAKAREPTDPAKKIYELFNTRRIGRGLTPVLQGR